MDMMQLETLYLEEHSDLITSLVAEHIDAEVVLTTSRNDLGNRLALSIRGRPGLRNVIRLVKTISITEQISSILDMAKKAQETGLAPLETLAKKLMQESSSTFLKFLLLHEIAHVKNNWGYTREIDCHLWAARQMAC